MQWTRLPAGNTSPDFIRHGETDAALTWLDRAYRQHDGQIEVIKIDPMLRSLHGDPRFHALLAKMKLAD